LNETESEMAERKQNHANAEVNELKDEQLDQAVGGAVTVAGIRDGTSNIVDGTSNIKDGTSHIIDGTSNIKG
jgi:hypothetical protein